MKTYDCFIYCGEDDLLNLRFKILNKNVDYFVICESSKFHSGVEKKKLFNIKKFKKYKNKIRYYYLKDMPLHDGNNWAYENYQRNSLNKGLFDANPEDIVLVSDVDEIPNLDNEIYRNSDSTIFLQNFYYYKLNILCYDGLKWKKKWPGTKAIKYKFFKSAQKTRELRVKKIPAWRIDQKIKRIILEEGGWHFSYLMKPKQIKNKIENFAHKEYKKYNKINHIKKMIKEKKDLFNRKNLKFKITQIDKSYPYEVINNMKKYKKWIETN